MEVSKSDWKLFRARIGDWQEAYMERLVKEYVDLLVGEENASDKFWNLEERIKKDMAEKEWKQFADSPYLSGIFLWTGMDYRGEPTPMSYPAVYT